MSDEPNIVIAWYAAEDWATIKARAADADKMDDSYADWLAGAMKLERTLRKQGTETLRVLVAPGALTLWCVMRGLKNDAAARSKYAAELAEKQSF